MLAAIALAVAAAAAPADIRVTSVLRPASDQPHLLQLTPAQMLNVADSVRDKGDFAASAAIYIALESDPDPDIRAEARFRHAKMLLGLKRNREAALLFRRVVDDKPDAMAARLELAHALQLAGDPDGALRELRAVQSSGLPPAVARLLDRYSQALRASRPRGASLEIAIAPDSNINRATRSDTLGTIFGNFQIDQDGKAKSGTGLSLNGQAYRRLALGGDDSLLVRLSGFGDLYRKSRFNDLALDLAAGPELRLGRNQLNLEAGVTQRWFGQKPFMRSARVGATLVRPLGDRTQLRLSSSASLIDNRLNDLQDGKGYSGRVEVERALSPTTGIDLSLSGDRQALKDPGYATTGWRLGLFAWRDVGRLTFTAGGEFGKLHADERLILFPERRSDRYSRLSLGVTMRQLQWRGFAPLLRFSIERNRSTIAFYDFRRTRTEFGIARAF